jgi:parvulin-like peptidyl-prolyl isomerase
VTKRLAAVGTAFVVLSVVLLAVAGCGSGDTLPANVLGRVGKVEITQDQFDAEVAVFKGIYTGQVPDEKTDPTGYKNFQNAVLDHMVTYELVKEEAASLKISVTDQEVSDHIDLVKKNSFGGDQSKFDAGLKASNLTLAQLQTYYREQILIQKASTEVTKGVAGASEAEISAYYDAHKSSFIQPETRAVRHILIAPVAPGASSPRSSSGSSSTTVATPTAADWAAALTKAEKVRADLVAGADWKTEAATYSDDPGTKTFGGDLGTISKGQMVAQFDQAAFSLAQDEISQPIRTVYGYHIIQVTGINPPKQLALADVKSSIQSILLAQKQDPVWKDWLATKKAELKVVVAPGMELTTTTSAPQSATTTSAPPQTTGTGGSVSTAPATTSSALPSSMAPVGPQQTTATTAKQP